MKTIITLIKREYWEQTNLFVKVPLALAVVISLAGFAALIFSVVGPNVPADWDIVDPKALQFFVQVTATPFAIVLGLLLFYYFVTTLYEDRRDRSVLFWQSMPIAQWQTLFSKCAAGLVLAPLITGCITVITQAILLIFLSLALAMHGVHHWADLWRWGLLLSTWIQMALVFIVQSLWLFPLYAWCLFWSAYAKRMPSLSALVTLVVVMLLEVIFLKVHPISQFVSSRFTFSAMTWRMICPHTHLVPVQQYTLELLLGLVVGIVFVAVAAKLRSRCYDFDH